MDKETVLDVLLRNFHQFSDKNAVHWVNSQCNIEEKYTYEELDRKSLQVARSLLHRIEDERSFEQAEERQRVVLCYYPGLEFIITFLGCLRAGLIPGADSCNHS